jgi:leucyl aminopeptidase
VGLGEKVAALYSSHKELQKLVQNAAQRADEELWPMPLVRDYKESLRSNIADLKNIAGQKGGGSITAALFLQEFVEKTPWAHIG